MKNLFLHTLLLGFLFASCSNDDDTSSSEVFETVTYKLISVNVENPIDIDGDGMPNRNEMFETDCYADTKIILESPTEFYNITQKFGYLDSGFELFIACQTKDYNGVYELSENQLIIKGHNHDEEVFGIMGDQLTVSYDWTFFEGKLTKKVEFIYQKQ